MMCRCGNRMLVGDSRVLDDVRYRRYYCGCGHKVATEEKASDYEQTVKKIWKAQQLMKERV